MKSNMNYKYREGQLSLHWSFFCFSVLFWIASAMTGHPVMPVEVYGDAVRLFDAQTWALAQMTVSALVLWGLYKNGRSALSPWARVIGNFGGFATYLYFSLSAALSAQFPEAVTLAAAVVFAAPCLRYGIVSMLDLRNPHHALE